MSIKPLELKTFLTHRAALLGNLVCLWGVYLTNSTSIYKLSFMTSHLYYINLLQFILYKFVLTYVPIPYLGYTTLIGKVSRVDIHLYIL